MLTSKMRSYSASVDSSKGVNDCGTPRVVEQDVEFAKAVDGGLEHALDLLVVGDVDGDLFGGAAGRADV